MYRSGLPQDEDKTVNQHDGVDDIFQSLRVHVIEQFVAQIDAWRNGQQADAGIVNCCRCN